MSDHAIWDEMVLSVLLLAKKLDALTLSLKQCLRL
jgi:hypothetical protein